MIHYVKINNFGPVKDQVELNFEVGEGIEEDAYEVAMPDGKRLLKLAYIYGANASGKTTLLDAIEFMKDLLLNPLGKKSDELEFEPFLLCKEPYGNLSSFELSFYTEGVRYIYEVAFNKQSILNEKLIFYKSAKPTELFSRETDLAKKLTRIQFGNSAKVSVREKDLLESNTLHNNTVFGAFTKTNADIPFLDKISTWFGEFFLEDLSNNEYLNALTAVKIHNSEDVNTWMNEFLNKADNQVVAVSVPDLMEQMTNKLKSNLNVMSLDLLGKRNTSMSFGRAELNLEKKSDEFRVDLIHRINQTESYTLPLAKESKGTQRYFGLGGPLYDLVHGSHFLCIDELENSLHADLMKHFLQLFLMNAKSSQLLITTHNLSLMEDSDFIRRDALWFTEKSTDGGVSLYAASDFDTSVLRKDANLSKAYKAGRLGAKPNLGSPYMTEN